MMQCSNINCDDLPSSISEYFTPGQFAELCDYEKLRLSNLRQNFEALRRAGFSATPPEFMLRGRSRTERQKLLSTPVLASSDESDVEWTPALEKPKKTRVNQRNRLFEPPKKTSLKDDTIKRVPEPTKWIKKSKMQTGSDDEGDEVHVYPLRKKGITSYMSLATPDDDDFLYCEECRQEYDGHCPVHGPLHVVDDTEVSPLYPSESGEHSKRTLPEGLVIKKSEIPNAGLGVFAVKDFPVRTWFGPYKGKKERSESVARDSGYSWQASLLEQIKIMKNGQTSHFLDGKDPSVSNWMRYVNCARHEDEQSVTAYQYQGEIYYRSHRPIYAGTEILVYYGDSYANDLGIQISKTGRKLQRSKSLPDSDMTTESDEIFSCAECHRSFSQSCYLQRHVKYRHHNKCCNNKLHAGISHISNQLRNEDCTDKENDELCVSNKSTNTTRGDESSTEGKNVKLNINEHPGKKYCNSDVSSEECNKCGICNGDFNTCALKTHTKMYIGEKPHRCGVGNVSVSTSGTLKTCARKQTGEKSYKCDVCFTECSTLRNKKSSPVRILRKFTGQKTKKCDICNIEFRYTSALNRHKRTHTGEKPYECVTCNAKFSQSGNLNSHLKIHTGEKPYKCDVCEAGFRLSDSLKKHKRVHTGERPYKCDVCEAAFSSKSTFKRHKLTHTGEKPHKCDICNVRFRHRSGLNRHKKTHKEEKH